MIAIVDYGVGNIFSLYSSFKSIGAEVVLTGDADEIRAADKIILPGVGAFGDAAEKLRDSGLAQRRRHGESLSLASAWACSFYSKKAMSTENTTGWG